ncbi:SOS response-associated peptidase family protein [Altericista sp. CCNU0014]|uniref:SOS response-associated peptidase family protein n=1 Tax=Altericista sp. CCNU0014 TaxID=3082949 RepID=UPI00385044A9
MWQGLSAFKTCTVLTTAANGLLQPIHDRMSVILSPEDYLSGAENSKELKALEDSHLGKLNASVHRISLLERGISRWWITSWQISQGWQR